MKIIVIAAHDPNLVIGNNGALPWHFSEDLKHFKKTTSGFPILMGRGVFEELGSKPLPNRQNIVLSTTRNYDNVACYTSLEQAIEAKQVTIHEMQLSLERSKVGILNHLCCHPTAKTRLCIGSS